MQISDESLAYWYLRLNGFLTIQNFIMHDNTTGDVRGEADLIGVRFPYREELYPYAPITDDSYFRSRHKTYIVLADSTIGDCKINNPWIHDKRGVINYLLSGIGAMPRRARQKAVKSIFKTGIYSDRQFRVAIVCIGKCISDKVTQQRPKALQIEWPHVKAFIFRRLIKYDSIKSNIGQWDCDGQQLKKQADNVNYNVNGDVEHKVRVFCRSVSITERVRT